MVPTSLHSLANVHASRDGRYNASSAPPTVSVANGIIPTNAPESFSIRFPPSYSIEGNAPFSLMQGRFRINLKPTQNRHYIERYARMQSRN